MGVRVLVIGLDSEPPSMWTDLRAELPNLMALKDRGVFLPLRSTDPPITVPAWISMLSGRDPGELGIYGFRNRSGHGYEGLYTVTSKDVKVPRVWDVLTANGLSSVVLGVPGTSPPVTLRGAMVSDFLTPPGAPYTYPAAFARLVESVAPGYKVDVEHFRSDEPGRIRDEAFAMTEQRMTLATYALKELPWDFFMVHEIGLDRIHHAFWQYMDPAHPRFVPGSPYESVVRDYHRYLDTRIGELVEAAPEDTVIFVVSDHGSRPMSGGVFVNDFLRREGLLVLREEPSPGQRFSPALVDFSRTQAWAEGGYYARVFLNVQGREPEGVVPQDRIGAVCDRITQGLTDLVPDTIGVRPEAAYRESLGVPPDLMVYLGGLAHRALATVGHDDLLTLDNDTGPDGANHDAYGVFLAAMRSEGRGRILPRMSEEASILDVASTLLAPFGLSQALPGTPIVEVAHRG